MPSCTLPPHVSRRSKGFLNFLSFFHILLFAEFKIPISSDLDHPCLRMIIASSSARA